MHFIKAVAAIFLLLQSLSAGANTVLNVKKDFGAKGDGRTDDTRSFLAAAQQVNKLKSNVTLIVPAGNYSIRPQNPANEAARRMPSALEVLAFAGCSNLSIKGEKGTKIKYAAGLYFGSFRMDGSKLRALGTKTVDYQYRVAIGHGIKLTACKNVSISNIEMDGNNGSMILGSEFGDTGYQVDNDGVFVENTTDLTLTACNFHHFGRDGILILNKTPQNYDTPPQGIRLSHCRFEYNARQAFSWVGGVGFSASDCSFSYTGSGKFSSAPGAGVDFEPNSGYIVKGGIFTDCSFIKNSGVSIITDEGGPYSRDVQFVNCKVVAGNNAAIWIKGAMFRFINCDIKGGFLFGCPATRPEDGTRFTGCHFSDAGTERLAYNFLVESNGARYLLFDSCDFRATQKALIFVSPASSAEAEKPTFNSCLFQTNYSSDAVVGKKAGLYSTHTNFTGKTTFVNSGTAGRHTWNLASSAIASRKGSPSNVTIGKGFTVLTYETIRIGSPGAPATLTVEAGGALMIYHNAGLSVAPGSALVLKRGGALWVAPGVAFNVRGQIVAEEGAAICINEAAKADSETYRNIRLKGKVAFGDTPEVRLGLNSCKTLGR